MSRSLPLLSNHQESTAENLWVRARLPKTWRDKFYAMCTQKDTLPTQWWRQGVRDLHCVSAIVGRYNPEAEEIVVLRIRANAEYKQLFEQWCEKNQVSPSQGLRSWVVSFIHEQDSE